MPTTTLTPSQHFYKAGARLARTSVWTRTQAIHWMCETADCSTDQQTQWMIKGFDDERAEMKKAGGYFGRIGKRLGARR